MGRKLVGNNGNDKIYTPDVLALSIVKRLQPTGVVLEPCAGGGSFCRAFKHIGLSYEWCEIDKGRDFFKLESTKATWLITNPPFSLISRFLEHAIALEIPNIAFLCTVNAIWMNGKLNTLHANHYQLKQILLVESPYFRRLNNWPQSGFSLGVLHIGRVPSGKPAIANKLAVSTLDW